MSNEEVCVPLRPYSYSVDIRNLGHVSRPEVKKTNMYVYVTSYLGINRFLNNYSYRFETLATFPFDQRITPSINFNEFKYDLVKCSL